MDAVAPLVGVVIGGLLVLVSDFVRRRVEWRRELVKSLAASGTDLVVLMHSTVGELAEAREASAPVTNVNAGRADRLQAYSRFYANPGSRALQAAGRPCPRRASRRACCSSRCAGRVGSRSE